jgi:hypothetical protein
MVTLLSLQIDILVTERFRRLIHSKFAQPLSVDKTLITSVHMSMTAVRHQDL